jgi:hypothetical protein
MVKHLADENVEKHIARFVGRGFSQSEEVEYDESFHLVVR